MNGPSTLLGFDVSLAVEDVGWEFWLSNNNERKLVQKIKLINNN